MQRLLMTECSTAGNVALPWLVTLTLLTVAVWAPGCHKTGDAPAVIANASQASGVTAVAADQPTSSATRLPRLVDLGAGKCVPCKMMAPILDELKEEYAGVMDVVFIDVWENPGLGDMYKIETIPTQIFYDAAGQELFRHVGFFSKEEILAKWKELGVELQLKPSSPAVES